MAQNKHITDGLGSGNEAQVNSNNALKTYLNNEVGDISVQNPLPTDGDSVYIKDIWLDESDIGNFSGNISDLFNNLHTQITNTTSNDPKTIIIHFNRTIVSNSIGLGCTGGGDFSNVKIKLRSSGGLDFPAIDESSNNTKYTSRGFSLPITIGFNALILEFHTTDTITLSNCGIGKTISVVARLQGTKPDNTVVDLNSTAGGNFKVSLEEFDDTFLSNPLPVTMTSTSLALQMDEAGSGITYVGEAAIASATSAAVWRIKRIDESGDPELIIKWSDGDANFDNIWDDRASITYS